MKFNILAADDYNIGDVIDEALELATANDILLINYTEPKVYEKLAANLCQKHGITVMKKDKSMNIVNFTLIIYSSDNSYELYKHKHSNK